jgi:hypothetical protein
MVTERVCPVPPWVENPYRLVSLGELMKYFQAHHFLELANSLGRIEDEGNRVERAPDAILPPNFRQTQADQLDSWIGTLDYLGLTAPSKAVRRIQTQLRETGTDVPTNAWFEFAKDMRMRLFDATEDIRFLAVASSDTTLYDDGEVAFGSEVLDAFPSVALDVDESGKCLALDRYTACVFHLTRVLQSGLYALATELGCKTVGRNWGVVIGDMEKAITARKLAGHGKGKSAADKAAWKDKTEFYAGAAMHFNYLTDAFRNRTIHKTGYLFPPEKAQSIFSHTREFMQHLATELSEVSP